jgi:hypothetical protein
VVRRAARRKLTDAMNAKKSLSDSPAPAAISANPDRNDSPSASGKAHRVIKLGVDVHWREHVVVRQVDGTAPQPAQRFTPEAFIAWVAKQVQQADVVHCCYEAGPFGFVLHRRLVVSVAPGASLTGRNDESSSGGFPVNTGTTMRGASAVSTAKATAGAGRPMWSWPANGRGHRGDNREDCGRGAGRR